MKKLGIYIHVPYCIQRCPYCDFATYEQNQILPPQDYIQLILKEISIRHKLVSNRKINTIFFGGGTPSLIEPTLLKQVILQLQNVGFTFDQRLEVTLEINPGTMTENKLHQYLEMGINRFSVGAQSFDNTLLQKIGRKHTSDDTLKTLSLLKQHQVNYNFDLLFALPEQNLQQLQNDLDIVSQYLPPHISPYCLTVEESNPLSKNRPREEQQIEMFDLIENHLLRAGYQLYEISNYALPDYECEHNKIYWDDSEYWGVGLSAHSYLHLGQWGTRFWNTRSIQSYTEQMHRLSNEEPLLLSKDGSDYETLQQHQAMTDFCHTHLRTAKGLSAVQIEQKFGSKGLDLVLTRLNSPYLAGLILQSPEQSFSLSKKGRHLSNFVFEKLTFLPQEIE